MKKSSRKIMKKAYNCKTNNDIIQLYDKLGGDCQTVLLDGGYDAPNSISVAMNKVIDKNSLILDVGCGTGLLAEYLKIHGFYNIEGMDVLESMVNICKRKKLYKNVICQDARKSQDELNEKYDVVVGCGMFTVAHLNPKYLINLFNWIKKGGVMIASCTEPVINIFEREVLKIDRLICEDVICKEKMTLNYENGYSYKIYFLRKK